MKKTKLSLCMISCLLAVSGLAGCEKNKVKSSSEGVLLTYYVDGVEHKITADDILNQYYDDSSKYQAIYDQIYSVIVRNYFAKPRTPGKLYPGAPEVPLGFSQMPEIERDAKLKVEDDKATARSNADANNTRYKKELQAIFESKGVKTEKELTQKYIEELQKEVFEKNFYTYSLEEIKCGNPNPIPTGVDGINYEFNGYINDKLPYHVSHVMVALSDSSNTNYYNGTISDTDASHLANMVRSLESEKSFAMVAADSADVSSGEKQGDLGIMDFDTTFIDEFKLGIYAYEQFYKELSAEQKAALKDEIIDLSGSDYLSCSQSVFGTGLPLVEADTFDKLAAVFDKTTDENDLSVIGGSTLVFPRNVIYNKYLNVHSVYFIGTSHNNLYDTGKTYKAGELVVYDGAVYECIAETATGAFETAKWKLNPKYRLFNGEYVLHAQIGKDEDENPIYEPIIAVRGSSNEKQEIHFIVVNRSPFDGSVSLSKADRVVNGVKLSEYYTTFTPREAGYPTDEKGNKKKTYINSLNNDDSENRTRADSFASTLKSYDADKISKYMFLKYMNEEEITFGENQELAKALMKWINASVQKSNDSREEKWNETVDKYIEKLTKQNAERKKLMNELCVQYFDYANDDTQVLNDIVSWGDLDEADQAQIHKCPEALKLGANKGKTYWENTKIADAFKKQGGFFNDGETHI